MKVIALDIANLTDARYFSAMGVDWMGFDLKAGSGLTLDHIAAFAEWVEGPRFLLDVRGRSIDEIAEFLSVISVDGLFLDERTELSHFAGKVIRTWDDAGDADVRIVHTVGTNGDDTAEKWLVIRTPKDIAPGQHSGYVVSGGAEQMVGVKNYDDLDAIFARLR